MGVVTGIVIGVVTVVITGTSYRGKSQELTQHAEYQWVSSLST